MDFGIHEGQKAPQDPNERLHIPTRTLSCPITTRTVSKKFTKVSWKFPIKFRALLPLAHFKKGNF